MADIVDGLKRKRSKIEEVIKEQNRREGERKALLGSLEEDFGVSSVEEAEKKLDALDRELDDNEDSMRELDREMAAILEAAKNAEGS